jgi:NAD(P)-dependent dehydrogenase (short-subunit alcohol dehydrogenase family)
MTYWRPVFRSKLSITNASAREAARYRVRCNTVAPGPIETPLLNAARVSGQTLDVSGGLSMW